MATITISQLPNSGALTGTEVLPIVQNDVTVQTTVQDVANLGGGIISAGAGAGSTLRINNNNTASGDYSTVSGGGGTTDSCSGVAPAPNSAPGKHSSIGGGFLNTAKGCSDVISGGRNNSSGLIGYVTNTYDFTYTGSIDGIFSNVSPSSTLSGLGSGATFNFNFQSGVISSVSVLLIGSNYVSGDVLTFDGTLFGGVTGADNVTLKIDVNNTRYSTIGGGFGNTSSGYASTISGGLFNTASGFRSTLGGGDSNTANAYFSTVGGGFLNASSGACSTIGGGNSNTSSNYFSTVGGGGFNTASGNSSTVGGGYNNISSNDFSTIGGGRGNTASGCYSTISGGGGFYGHTASGIRSTIGGGGSNITSGNYSTVGGGTYNTADGNHTAILGGTQNNTSTCNCAMIVGSCITADRECATFVNNLSIKNIPTSDSGLPSGAVWRCTADNILRIIP